MGATRKRLASFSPETVQVGTVIWLKGSTAADISSFVTSLGVRGMDLFYAGPQDRYVVKIVGEVSP